MIMTRALVPFAIVAAWMLASGGLAFWLRQRARRLGRVKARQAVGRHARRDVR